MRNPITLRLAFLMSLPPLMWAGNAVVGRTLVGSVGPMTLNALRWWIALVLLLPLGWRLLRRPHDIVTRWKHLALLGLLGVGSYNALQYLALQTSTPINVTLIASSSPVWVLLFGALFYGEKVKALQWAGAVLSLSGVGLVLSRGSLDTLLHIRFVAGDLYILLAIALWALYSWQLARPPQAMRGAARPPWNWAEFLLAQVVFGALWASLAAAAEAQVAPMPIAWSAGLIAALLYIAVGPSLIAYRCWGLGVAEAGPAAAAFFSNLTPVFAALLSAGLLGELAQWYHAVAFGLIVAGIVVSSRR
ncbi:MAG: DMT family transporter [Burkholderiales bacterium]|nr:DMT family transporter [Burkholderiales bacterium]